MSGLTASGSRRTAALTCEARHLDTPALVDVPGKGWPSDGGSRVWVEVCFWALVMLPTSVAAICFTASLVGNSVCKGFSGNSLCSDNVMPGAIIAAFAFGLGHVAAVIVFRARSRWASYFKGCAITSCIALLLIFVERDWPNLIIACSLWAVWTSLYLVECLLKTQSLPRHRAVER